MKLSVPLAMLALAAVACDGDNTPGAAGNAGDSANDPSSVAATQPAPNTATQAAPNTATQAAPNTATQAAPNTATQSPTSSGNCQSTCNHVLSLGCSDSKAESPDCAVACADIQAAAVCGAEAQALLTCSSAATTCNALATCKAASDAFDTCKGGGTITPTQSCSSICSEAMAMNCGVTLDCASVCDSYDATGNCQTLAKSLMTCAQAATTCTALTNCGNVYQAFVLACG